MLQKNYQKKLREEDERDIIIAMTHSREPNNIKLAEAVDEIDLILIGHDHIYSNNKINGITILNSGCEFKTFSFLKVFLKSKESKMKNQKFLLILKKLLLIQLLEKKKKCQSMLQL